MELKRDNSQGRLTAKDGFHFKPGWIVHEVLISHLVKNACLVAEKNISKKFGYFMCAGRQLFTIFLRILGSVLHVY